MDTTVLIIRPSLGARSCRCAFAEGMSDHRIAILPGDGVGREVADEAKRILDTVQAHTNHGFEQVTIPCGGQNYKETGEEWAEGSFEFCRDEADAIFLGAIGYPGARLPNGDLAGGSVILGMRAGLDLYANVRPIKLTREFRTKSTVNLPRFGSRVWSTYCTKRKHRGTVPFSPPP